MRLREMSLEILFALQGAGFARPDLYLATSKASINYGTTPAAHTQPCRAAVSLTRSYPTARGASAGRPMLAPNSGAPPPPTPRC